MQAVCCAAALLVLHTRKYVSALLIVVPATMPSPRQVRVKGGVRDFVLQSAGTTASKRRRQSNNHSGGTSSAVRVNDGNADEAEEEPGHCEGGQVERRGTYSS